MKRARLLLMALVALNLLYFAWTQGGLAMFGAAPASLSEREPQRMAQQVRPAALQIRKESDVVAPVPAAAASPSEPAPAPPTSPNAPSTSSADHEGL
ncbi:hypothetical protein [Variovorax sp. dw_308]|uniref:hypothetical protein n=1 Tax=Variovorax sp. dw_308 TaxID=2721546 RepID=UPI00210938C8|nr:hypothetical protein [Variovorax sp. dw_308]